MSQGGPQIVNTRHLRAPRAQVSAAFADPQRLPRWWGPKGFTNKFSAFEFRPGGRWQFTKGFNHLGVAVALAPALGVLELACTLLYLVPRTAVLGAILLTGYLGGAIMTHCAWVIRNSRNRSSAS